MENPIFLPVLHSFENNNVFTGSHGALRYKITPQITMKTPKEVDFEASSMDCEIWYGALCYEKSTVADKKTFALSQTALEEMRAWIAEHISSEGEAK